MELRFEIVFDKTNAVSLGAHRGIFSKRLTG